MRSILLAALSLCFIVFSATAQDEDAPPPLTKDAVEASLERARAALAAIPADATPQKSEVVPAEVALLEEWLKLDAASTSRSAALAGLDARRTRAEARVAEQEALPPVAPPAAPTKEGFAQLESELPKQRDQVTALRERQKDSEHQLEVLPQQAAAARERSQAAARRATGLAADAAGAADEPARELARRQLANARLEEAVAAKLAADLEAEVEYLKTAGPVRRVEIALQEKRLDRLEAEFAAYEAALKDRLGQERKQKDEDVARTERAAETAATPADRLIARRETALARSRQKRDDVEALLVGLKKELSEQEKRLEAARDELKALRDYIARSGTSPRAAERLKKALASLPNRRSTLERSVDAERVGTLGALRDRRFEIEDMLFAIGESWQGELDEAIATLPVDEQLAFRRKAIAQHDSYRDELRDEMSVLTEAIALGQRLQNTQIARLESLDEMERFIRSKVFWVQDGLPLIPDALAPLRSELRELGAWSMRLTAPDTRASLRASLVGLRGILLGLLIFPLLPVLLVFSRRWLRRFVQRRHERTSASHRSARGIVLATLGVVVSSALLPAYLWFASRLVKAIDLPPDIGPVLGVLLRHLALFLFAWLLARSLFRPRGTAEVQYGLDPRAAKTLLRSLRVVLLGYVSLLLLWQVWHTPPFEFEALPRLAYTLFTLTALSGLFLLIRSTSGFVKYALARRPADPISRYWPAISSLVLLAALASIVLDTMGYRYGARSLAESVVYSLLTLFALWLLHDLVRAGIEALLRRRMLKDATAAPGEEAVSRAAIEAQTKGFVRALFVIVGVVVIAGFWGLDEQAYRTLDEIRLNSASATEFFSVADLLVSILYLVATIWILRNLAGIYEIVIFPRFDLDSGLRYAIVTMSRYALFFVGFFLSLGALHLDLSSMGWLAAAMGVGLGFGLQEIVSNFVSGIILLVERPIRVGDTVTLGANSGKVLRINIRSTTLLDFNRQEIIVPNRKFITQEVTNWTGADTIIRLQVPIGVAYGSDVDQVKDILRNIAIEQPDVLKDPAPSVVFLLHGESSLDFELRVFVPDPGVKMAVLDNINKEINTRLGKAGIEIPFPQRDLHIRSSIVKLGEATEEAPTPEPRPEVIAR